MFRPFHLLACFLAVLPASTPARAATTQPARLQIETAQGAHPKLQGRDAHLQLLVTAEPASGDLRDHTRAVTYRAAPGGIVTVNATGLVTAQADGQTTLTATDPDGATASLPIEVGHCSSPVAINFANQIVPLFTKAGCNSGGCHGKLAGQNGFRLSLLGFEPREDYEHLVY